MRDGSRAGGVRVYWAGEAETVTATKPKLRKLNFGLHKAVGIGYATEEAMEDTNAIGQLMENSFADELAFALQAAIISGNGVGRPLGITQSGCLVTASKEAGQVADTFLLENALAMWRRMPARNRRNAVWLINQNVEPQLYTMTLDVGTAGSAVFLPAGGASVAPYMSLFARPIIPIEQCETLGDAGDVILCDLSEYMLVKKASGVKTGWSAHVRWLYGEFCFRCVLRVDGMPIWEDPLTPYKGSDDLSPFVVCEAR